MERAARVLIEGHIDPPQALVLAADHIWLPSLKSVSSG